MIPEDQYARIIEALPILCVDILIKNPKGEYLLIKRARKPLMGEWWVIGGRVLKGETLENAAIRKIKEETGLTVGKVQLVGYYEDVSEANRFDSAVPLHSVSVVFLAVSDSREQVVLDYQSSDWKCCADLPERFRAKLVRATTLLPPDSILRSSTEGIPLP